MIKNKEKNKYSVFTDKIKKRIKPVYMKSRIAYHLLGNISREQYETFVAHYETKHYYIGNWVVGFGYTDVQFPKNQVKELDE